MGTQRVTVDLQVRQTGAIEISIDPWQIHTKEGDVISWNFTGDITNGTIQREYKKRVWPFEGNVPPLKGTKVVNAKTGKRLEHSKRAAKVIPYRVILQFDDPKSGRPRSAVIDPDMVID